MSIRVRFLFLIGVLSVMSILIIGIFSYQFSMDKALTDAREKGELVFNFLEASRAHFRNEQKPNIEKLLNTSTLQEELPAHLVSGFALTRGVWDKFLERNTDYIFKQATLDPLVETNKADEEDLKIIRDFQANPGKVQLSGTTVRENGKYYYLAEPIPVKKKCLTCHGDPQDAPAWQRKIYGTENGYNWKEGDIASAYIVYVPVQKAVTLAQKNALVLIGIGTSVILVLMLLIWATFQRYVINPLSMLEERTVQISLGKNLDSPIGIQSKDEIGALASAVDRLRISVEKMLSRLKK
ncbi:Tll0287-like domain-containing protein [Desulfogranum japonicum]|uniref:Tll0287-like domain-containing protein n=1 Tax=Desulfogranum japonicum TaxID=231447 RepID=UPI00048D46C5|nr:DUF3365 domain-containing protein [Desulfogranum japonicum]